MRPELETAVDRMQQVVLLGRQKREDVKIGLRTPLRRLTVVHRDQALLDDLRALESYVKAELNVLDVAYDTDESAYIELVAKPNFPLLGKRLGKRMKSFQPLIRALSAEQIQTLQAAGSITVDGEAFSDREIEVLQQPRPGTDVVSNRYIAVDLDTRLDETLIAGGYAREIVNRIQRQRKDLDLNVADRIEVRFDGDPVLVAAAQEHAAYISGEILAVRFEASADLAGAVETEVDDRPFRFIVRPASSGATA
jgi:isoleucyl-tRNA synthetase